MCFLCFFFLTPDDNVEPQIGTETPPPPSSANAEPLVEAKEEVAAQVTLPPDSSAQPVMEAVAAPEVQPPVTKDVQSPPSTPAAATAAASAAPPDETVSKADSKVGDTVDAPIGPSSSLQDTAVKTEEARSAPADSVPEKEEEKKEKPVELEKEEQVASAKLEPTAEVAATLEPINAVTDETATMVATEVCQPPPSEPEPAEPQTQGPAQVAQSEPEPVPAETAESPLYNGLPQDTDEELTEGTTLSDTTPPNKPDTALSQESTTVAKTAIPAQELQNEEKHQEESNNDSPSTEDSTTMQGRPLFLFWISNSYLLSIIYLYMWVIFSLLLSPVAATSVPKNTNTKELNKEATGDVQDVFTEVRIRPSCL